MSVINQQYSGKTVKFFESDFNIDVEDVTALSLKQWKKLQFVGDYFSQLFNDHHIRPYHYEDGKEVSFTLYPNESYWSENTYYYFAEFFFTQSSEDEDKFCLENIDFRTRKFCVADPEEFDISSVKLDDRNLAFCSYCNRFGDLQQECKHCRNKGYNGEIFKWPYKRNN